MSMTDLAIPEIGASSTDIEAYVRKIISDEYYEYGLGCALGQNYLRENISTMTPVESTLLQLFMQVTENLASSHKTQYVPFSRENGSVFSVIHKSIVNGDAEEARCVYFRWVRYYSETETIMPSLHKKLKTDMLVRCIHGTYPDLDEWGLDNVYFVPLD